jgi:hypothetical protein
MDISAVIVNENVNRYLHIILSIVISCVLSYAMMVVVVNRLIV